MLAFIFVPAKMRLPFFDGPCVVATTDAHEHKVSALNADAILWSFMIPDSSLIVVRS